MPIYFPATPAGQQAKTVTTYLRALADQQGLATPVRKMASELQASLALGVLASSPAVSLAALRGAIISIIEQSPIELTADVACGMADDLAAIIERSVPVYA